MNIFLRSPFTRPILKVKACKVKDLGDESKLPM